MPSRAFSKAGFIIGQDFDHIIRFRLIWLNALAGGGVQREKLMLTIDCAKSGAMMARTEKGREVRKWYLQLEKEWRSQKQKTLQLELEVNQKLSKFLEIQCQIKCQQRILLAKTEHLTESFEAHDKWLQGIDAELDRIESPCMSLFYSCWLRKSS
ncbi:MAG: hypothetical protein WBA41_24195, partial [Rivularia sp. (in: cyanobacteria)]